MTFSGESAGFPPEVVELMLQRQYEQRGRRDVRIFELNRANGFSWLDSPEGGNFWCTVIMEERFDLFFERYPQRKGSGSHLNYRSWD